MDRGDQDFIKNMTEIADLAHTNMTEITELSDTELEKEFQELSLDRSPNISIHVNVISFNNEPGKETPKILHVKGHTLDGADAIIQTEGNCRAGDPVEMVDVEDNVSENNDDANNDGASVGGDNYVNDDNVFDLEADEDHDEERTCTQTPSSGKKQRKSSSRHRHVAPQAKVRKSH